MIAPLDTDHPWPGPASFRIQDAAFFRGRDGEIQQLLTLIRRSRSVVLYGASGLGKTSLVNAGVIPRLGADEYFAVPIRICYHADALPVAEQIQSEILHCRSGEGMPAPRPRITAWEFLHLRDEPIEGAQPLLIFDQFEELFTIGRGTPQAAQLIEELKALVEDVPPASVRERLERFPEQARAFSFQRTKHRVLISVREDFLYGLEALRTQVPSIIHNRYRIGPLGGPAALEVVLQSPAGSPPAAAEPLAAEEPPAAPRRSRSRSIVGAALDVILQSAAGAPSPAADPPSAATSRRTGSRSIVDAPLVEPDVAELIVRTVAAAAADDRPLDALEVEPALLSILCAELARRRPPGTPITRKLVDGSRTDIIAAFYERAVHDAPASVRAYIEDVLVTATGYRTSAVVDEALGVAGFTSDVLSDLVNKRLLRVIERQKAKWLELTHDILTEIATRSRTLRQERQRAQHMQRVEQAARAARYRKRRNAALIALGGLVAVSVVFGILYRTERRSRWLEASQHELAAKQVETEQRARQAAEDAKHALRRQFIEASLREGQPHEAVAQLAAVVREQPEAAWARSLLGDLLLRRGWPVPVEPLFPQGPFTSLACNRSGSRCAAAYRNGVVLVRGDLSRRLVTDQNGYGSLFMSDDGERLILVPERPGTGMQWTFGPTDTHEMSFPVEDTWTSWWASSDARLVALPNGGKVVVWRLGAQATSTVIERKLGNAPFSVSRDGRWVAYLTMHDKRDSVVLADARGQTVRSIPASETTSFIAFDLASKVLVAGAGGTLRRWSVPDGRELPTLRASRDIEWVEFDSSGDRMALRLEGGGVELWTAPWRAPHVVMRSSHGVMSLSFAPDGRWLSVGARDGVVSSWTAAGTALAEPARVNGLAFALSLDDHGLLGASLGGSSARWVLPASYAPRQYDLGEPVQYAWFLADDQVFGYGSSRAFTPRGDDSRTTPVFRRALFVSRDRRHAVTAYNEGAYLREGMPGSPYGEPADHKVVDVRVDSVGFSADGTRVAMAGGGKGYVFDVATGHAIGAPIDDVTNIWLDLDGTMLATHGTDVGLTLWRDAGDGAWSQVAHVDEMHVSFTAFHRGSDAVAVVSENHARVYRLRDRQFTGQALMHDGLITAVAFSPDGRWIATGSADKRARIWEAASGLPASDWFEHDGSVAAVEFSPSGKNLLTASSDGHVRIWRVPGGGDAGTQERQWLARLGEILSGTRVDPATNEVVPARDVYYGLRSLRGEIEQACPRATPEAAGCGSATFEVIRAVLDKSGAGAPTSHTL